MIGFNFASDWLKEWDEFSGPITELVKQNQCHPALLSTLHKWAAR